MEKIMNLLEINMKDTKSGKSIHTISETKSLSGEAFQLTRTMIIFDFDDTLICTKYLDSLSLNYQEIFDFKTSIEDTNPYLVKELNELEISIIHLFAELQESDYDIIIVSNADMKWINNCLTHFFTELKDYIFDNNIKIYSAKNMFSHLTSNSSEWKSKCFIKIIKEKYLNESNIVLNIICIGDGLDEKKALFNSSSLLGNNMKYSIRAKFIQVIDSPSVTSIILQLKYIQENISKIKNENKKLFQMMLEIKNQSIQIKCVSYLLQEKNVSTKRKKINKDINNIDKLMSKNFFNSINNENEIKEKEDKDDIDVKLFTNNNENEAVLPKRLYKFFNYPFFKLNNNKKRNNPNKRLKLFLGIKHDLK